jgi:hypothetical protein
MLVVIMAVNKKGAISCVAGKNRHRRVAGWVGPVK